MRIEQPESGFDLWQENVSSLALFVACSTQWRRAGMSGVPVGLDYAGVDAAARMTGVEITPARFADLQIMEMAALSVWAEEQE